MLAVCFSVRDNRHSPLDIPVIETEAILSPHSANRHDAGCRGPGAGRLFDENVNAPCPSGGLFPEREDSGMIRLPTILLGAILTEDGVMHDDGMAQYMLRVALVKAAHLAPYIAACLLLLIGVRIALRASRRG